MASSKQIFDKIKKLGIPIPPVGVPNGLYDMVTIWDGIAYTSGQLSRLDNEGHLLQGPIGAEEPLKDAITAARVCFVRGLTALDIKLGDLERIKKIIFIRGFVNAKAGFTRHSQVLDGVSQMAIDLFGAGIGTHSRSALGAGSLPSSGLVEIEIIASVTK